jgi:hypothetical protein
MRKQAIGILFFLAGCASGPTPAQEAAFNRDAARDVVCEGQEDCEVKWGRAIQFTLDNSYYRIQQQTDALIQTAGPLPNYPNLVMVISKIPLGGGQYRFDLRGGCDNMFGCVPTLIQAKAYFVRTVMDGKSGPQPQ